MLRKIRDFLIIAAVTFVLLEIGLRIYNPIYVPLRADQIELPVNRVFKMVNVNNKKVDRELVNTYNAIGLRGPNYPDKPDEYVKIITVGGVVTLRGPVTTPAEKESIGAKAQKTAGVIKVDNQLEVASE